MLVAFSCLFSFQGALPTVFRSHFGSYYKRQEDRAKQLGQVRGERKVFRLKQRTRGGGADIFRVGKGLRSRDLQTNDVWPKV